MNEEGETSLSSYLHELAIDKEALEYYVEDPVKALKESGLSWKNRFLLLTGDLEAIRKELVEEAGDDAATHLIVTVWMPTVWIPTVWGPPPPSPHE
jgi:hypothetical protein